MLRVKKILLYLFLAFVALNILLYFFPLSKEVFYTNRERAEEFVYSKYSYPVVFAGSGLIGDFDRASVKRENYFNLFFPYSGSCTGVEIIARSGKIPDTIFVELNYIGKGLDEDLVSGLFNNWVYPTRRYIPLLQKKHYPFSLVKEILKPSANRQLKTEKYPEPRYSQSVQKYGEDYSRLNDTIGLHKTLLQLKRNLSYLQSKGSTVVFFEMPVEHHLDKLAKKSFERSAIQSAFAKNSFIWIPADTMGAYSTDDGVHLLEKSKVDFLEYLNTQLAIKKSMARR
jgi:hypothetical protein